MANANASASAFGSPWEKRPEAFFYCVVDGGEASLRWINSFLEETAYHLMNRQPVC